MDLMFFFGFFFGNVGFNIIVMFFNGELGVGIVFCFDLLLDLWGVVDGFFEVFKELLECSDD